MAEHTRDFLYGDNGVSWAIVFGERAVFDGVVVKSCQARLTVVGQFRDIKKFARNDCNIGSHYGDVGVAGADVSALDGIRRVEDGIFDLSLKVFRQPMRMVKSNLEQLHAAEVGPVPVRWRHFFEGFFEEPRPYSVGSTVGILILEGDNFAENVLCPCGTVWVTPVKQSNSVLKRITGRVDIATFQGSVVARRREGSANHFFNGVIA